MPMYGGIDLGDLRPLSEGEELLTGVRGSHRANASALNVHNAQPGFRYSWIRHPRHDRGGAQLQEYLSWGYEVCGKDSPEIKGRSTNLSFSDLGLDNYQAHGDVLLVRITDEKFRVRQEDRAAAAKAALDGASDAFINKGRELEERYSFAKSAEGPLYYKGPAHFVGNPDQRRLDADGGGER